jgi:regulator of replication initiation timing
VTKQTQEIIQGKHMKRDEEDKKRLEQQIKQLEENTANRIAAIGKIKKKLNREIREKRAENEQLESKARFLKQSVDDRQSIIKLKSDKAEDTSDPKKKIQEIAQQRKLMEVI